MKTYVLEPVLETAIPHIPLSIEFATSTSSNGFSKILPFTTRVTVPLSFSKTRKSSGPTKAIVVGVSSPCTTCSTLSLESKTFGWAGLKLNGRSLKIS